MQALHLENKKTTYSFDYPTPQANNEEALIKVRLAGICSTDLEIIKGYAGFHGIVGHEFVGRVEESADTRWRRKSAAPPVTSQIIGLLLRPLQSENIANFIFATFA